MNETIETLKRLVDDWWKNAFYGMKKAEIIGDDKIANELSEHLDELTKVKNRLESPELENFWLNEPVRRTDIENHVLSTYPRVADTLKWFEIYKYNNLAYRIDIDADQDLGTPPMTALRIIIQAIERKTLDHPNVLIRRT